jgi:subtilase family serine protease
MSFGVLLLAFCVGVGDTAAPALQRRASSAVRLQGHVPLEVLKTARWKGQLSPSATISMVIALPLRNQPELRELLAGLYDPADPQYGQYLTPQEFTDRFGPTQADYDLMASYVRSQGLTVTGTHSNRLLLNISGSAQTVEAAFALQMQSYQEQDGREFYAPDIDPQVPEFIASRIVGVIGLDNAAVRHAHSHFSPVRQMARTPLQIGSGPGGALTPSDIASAYNLVGMAADGTGQTLGLFELDGYADGDIAAYESYFNLPEVPLKNVLVDGFSGLPKSGASEVTLDIELQIALAPGASQIIVYEGPNTDPGVLDTYNRIATDNSAQQISTSWGESENRSSSALLSGENSIFQEMAAQGQSIFAASGDSGAYDKGSTLSVEDPASQPFITGTGGTQLFVAQNKSYDHETTWNESGLNRGSSGGGISAIWSIPSYQQGVVSASSMVSSVMRNVPDVSLNADPTTGYSIYYKGGWHIFGGTSCAAPLWAAFAALVNQQRATNGQGLLGFANPAIYQIGAGANYNLDFHDIADGSTNLYYPSVTGYDAATGWGSFNGAGLLTDLGGAAPPPALRIMSGPTAVPGRANARIQWTTSVASTAVVYYGTDASHLNLKVSIRNRVTVRSLILSGLSRRTRYYYRVFSTADTATVSSDVLSFITEGAILEEIGTSPTGVAGGRVPVKRPS